MVVRESQKRDNPFTLLYRGLWDALETNTNFTSIVQVGNRIQYDITAKEKPEKRNVKTADLPEVALFSEGFEGNLTATTNTTILMHRLIWGVTTGSFNYTLGLAQVQWAILESMNAFCTNLTTLTWEGTNFVKHLKLLNNDDTVRDVFRNRGIEGWSCGLRFEVKIAVPRTALQPNSRGIEE